MPTKRRRHDRTHTNLARDEGRLGDTDLFVRAPLVVLLHERGVDATRQLDLGIVAAHARIVHDIVGKAPVIVAFAIALAYHAHAVLGVRHRQITRWRRWRLGRALFPR